MAGSGVRGWKNTVFNVNQLFVKIDLGSECESNRLVFLLAYEFCIRVGFHIPKLCRHSKSSLMAPKVS